MSAQMRQRWKHGDMLIGATTAAGSDACAARAGGIVEPADRIIIVGCYMLLSCHVVHAHVHVHSPNNGHRGV
jgi:hypothetical protein